MDPFHLCVALGPIAVYLLLLGLLNLGTRPFLTTGGRDSAALAVGISGFVIAGPMELFLPELAAYRFGGYVWLLLLSLYGLVTTLVVLLLRPRLVIYNLAVEQLRPILASIVPHLDDESRWSGDTLSMPKLGVRLHVEQTVSFRNLQLVSVGSHQNLAGWRRLEIRLRQSLRSAEVRPNPRGVTFIVVAVVTGILITISMISDQPAVAQALRDMLRL
jgi:hypothetical protein